MYGKIVLIKSLVCSLLQYVGHVYVIPDVYIKELESIVWTFLWNGKKKGRIKKLILCKDYEKGGLNMIDIRSSLKTQRVLWLKKLLSETCPFLSSIVNFMFSEFGGLNLLARYNFGSIRFSNDFPVY